MQQSTWIRRWLCGVQLKSISSIQLTKVLLLPNWIKWPLDSKVDGRTSATAKLLENGGRPPEMYESPDSNAYIVFWWFTLKFVAMRMGCHSQVMGMELVMVSSRATLWALFTRSLLKEKNVDGISWSFSLLFFHKNNNNNMAHIFVLSSSPYFMWKRRYWY